MMIPPPWQKRKVREFIDASLNAPIRLRECGPGSPELGGAGRPHLVPGLLSRCPEPLGGVFCFPESERQLMNGLDNKRSARTMQLLLLLSVSVPSFMINLDANIVAVSLPSIARSLHAGFVAIEWVVSGYTLTFGCLVLPAGALADRYGRKRFLLLGVGIFTVGSLLCAVAPSVVVLNSARVLQGAGAGLQLSASLALLSHEFNGADRARAFAFWGMMVGTAIVLGPIAGGITTQTFGWEWAFCINPPIGLGLIILVLRFAPESADPAADHIDVPGFILFSSGVFALTLALISGNAHGWSSSLVVVTFVCAVALLSGFVVAEARQRRPMVDLHLFGRPTFVGANIAALAFAATLLTMLTYLPIYFQGALGCAPLQAGLLILPLGALLVIVPRLVAVHLTHRLSGRTLLTAGLSLVAVGLVALAIAAPLFSYVTLIPGLIAAGTGAGVLNSEVVKVGMTVIPPERAGMASGVSGTVRFTGIVIGFAALGAVFAGRVTSVLHSEVGSLGATLSSGRISHAALARSVIAGNLTGAVSSAPETARPSLHSLVMTSFGEGFQAILLVAAAFAAISALLTWALVRQQDTTPVERKIRTRPLDAINLVKN
jgi:EmrB/QacA subfamily drug resistance transporter